MMQVIHRLDVGFLRMSTAGAYLKVAMHNTLCIQICGRSSAENYFRWILNGFINLSVFNIYKV